MNAPEPASEISVAVAKGVLAMAEDLERHQTRVKTLLRVLVRVLYATAPGHVIRGDGQAEGPNSLVCQALDSAFRYDRVLRAQFVAIFDSIGEEPR